MPRSIGTYLAALFALIPLSFVGLGGVWAWNQHRRIARAVPVPAVILTSSVASHQGSKGGVTYSPEVTFSYTPAGSAALTGRDFFPLNLSTSNSAWASDWVAKFPPGTRVQAYADPANSDGAFLVRHYTFFPYVFALVGMLVLGIFSATWLDKLARPAPPTPVGSGWYELSPVSRLGQAVTTRLTALIVLLLGLLVPAHYFSVADTPYESLATWSSAIYLLACVVAGGLYARAVLLAGVTRDAIVLVQPAPAQRGAPLSVRVELPMLKSVSGGRVGVRLVCRETISTRDSKNQSTTRSSTLFALDLPDAPIGAPSGPGLEQPAGNQGIVDVPIDQPASTPTDQTGSPKHEWYVEVRGVFDAAPDYRAEFPIVVI